MCCATKNKLLMIVICKVPWSHPQRRKTYSHFFSQRTSSPRLTLRSSFEKLHVWRSLTTHMSLNWLVSQHCFLWCHRAPPGHAQSHTASCRHPHCCPTALPVQSPLCCLESLHVSALLLPRPRGSWNVCKCSQRLPSHTDSEHLLFKPRL